MKRYGHIDLEGNQLIDVLFENLVSAPTPATGRVYFNSTDAIAQVYDGSNWVDLWAPDDDFYNNLASEPETSGNDAILIYDDSAGIYKSQSKDGFFQNITGYLPAPVTPAGSNRDIQFNDSSSFGADTNFQWDTNGMLYVARSHTDTFSETVQPANPGQRIYNPNTTTGNKHATLEMSARYSSSYTSRGYIVLSTNGTSNRSDMAFMVEDSSSVFWTPLLIRGQEGAVLQDSGSVWRFYVTPAGGTVKGSLTVNDSGANLVSIESTTTSDVYVSFEDSGGVKGQVGWDYSASLMKFNYGSLGNNHFTMDSNGRINMNSAIGNNRLTVADDTYIPVRSLFTSTDTSVQGGGITIQHSTTAAAVAGFGTALYFLYTDSTRTDHFMGYIQCEKSAAGTGSEWNFVTELTGGAYTSVFKISDTGGLLAPYLNSASTAYSVYWNNSTGELTRSSSDINLKENIRPWEYDSLALLRKLPLIQFDWREKEGPGELGWSAQDLRAIMPEMVGTDKQGFLMIKDNWFPKHFHQAIVQVDDKVTRLEKEVEELKRQLDDEIR